MNFKEAINHIANKERTEDLEFCLLGVAYLPNDSDGEFQVIGIELNNDEEEEGVWVNVIVEGGSVGSSSGTEGYYGGEDYENIIVNIKNEYSGESILAMLESLNYQFFNINRPMGGVAEQSLFEIFPTLPEPNESWDFNHADFKMKAIEQINSLNKVH